jgi:hypothetical protein
MGAVGHNHTKNCSVRIWTAGGSINISTHGNSVDIDYNADDLEATAYGDQAHTFLAGLTNYSITYSGWWAGSHATAVADSVAACLFNAVAASTNTSMIQVAPAGSSAGSLSYVACVNFQAFPVSLPSDNIATMSFTCTPRSGSLSSCADSVWT